MNSNHTESVRNLAERLLKSSFISKLPLPCNCKEYLAFTLAEVLITLTIIGVIAALTIPSLLQNIQDAQYKTAWRRSYSDLRQAVSRLVSDNGGSLKGISYNTNTRRDSLLTYLSYVNKCNAGATANNCWLDQAIASPNGTVIWTQNVVENVLSSSVLNNGSIIFVNNLDNSCNNNTYSGQIKICAEIAADVNGIKGPNIVGKDIFFMWLTENNLIPNGSPGDNGVCYSGEWKGCSSVYLYQ